MRGGVGVVLAGASRSGPCWQLSASRGRSAAPARSSPCQLGRKRHGLGAFSRKNAVPPLFRGREQCGAPAVDIANNFAVNAMSADHSKRGTTKDFLFAAALVTAGLVICGLSVTQLRTRDPQQLAQATPPLQSTPGAESKPSAPSEARDDRHKAVQHSARTGTARRRGAESRRPARAAASAGGEDGSADQGKVELSFRGVRSTSPESILPIVVMNSGSAPSGASRNDD